MKNELFFKKHEAAPRVHILSLHFNMKTKSEKINSEVATLCGPETPVLHLGGAKVTSVARQSWGTQEGMVDDPRDCQEADRTKFRERAPRAVPAKRVLHNCNSVTGSGLYLVFVPVTGHRFRDKW